MRGQSRGEWKKKNLGGFELDKCTSADRWKLYVFCFIPAGVLWFNYEILKARLLKLYGHNEATFPVAFSSGALAGGVSEVLIL